MIYHLINYNDNLQLYTILFSKYETEKTIGGDIPTSPSVHTYQINIIKILSYIL